MEPRVSKVAKNVTGEVYLNFETEFESFVVISAQIRTAIPHVSDRKTEEVD